MGAVLPRSALEPLLIAIAIGAALHQCVEFYLDYNASTPIDSAVADAMRPYLELHYGNPSSGHWAADPAKAALDNARGQVAALLDCHSDEIVFTSGAAKPTTSH